MDEKLLPYFENVNDGTAQEQFLEAFGSEKVQGGICLNLVLAWIYFYKKDATKAPNRVWNEMKNPTTLKQISQNQEAYLEKRENPSEELNEYDCINLYGLSTHATVDFNSVDEIKLYVPVCLQHSNTLLLVINLANGEKGKIVGAHAIGIIQHDNKIYMYDPNVGVLTVPSENLGELLNKIHYIYEEKYGYVICGRNVIEVQ